MSLSPTLTEKKMSHNIKYYKILKLMKTNVDNQDIVYSYILLNSKAKFSNNTNILIIIIKLIEKNLLNYLIMNSW